MSDGENATCETCRYFNQTQGECRRRAPMFNDACGSIFPQNLEPADWCGEHQPKEPPP